MQIRLNRLPGASCSLLVTLVLMALATQRCLAATVIYVGTNSVSATTNWSDKANFVNASGGAQTTPANNAANFNWDTAAANPGVVTVHVDGGYGTPGSGSPQAWGMIFGQTNGYHTVLIDPGMQLEMIAANGTPGGGGLIVAPANRNSGGNTGGNVVPTGPYTNHTTIMGTGASFLVNGQFRVEAGSTAANNHYSILDLSGLDTLIVTNTAGTSSRFQIVNGIQRSQALVYLAKTNLINIYSDATIGYLGNIYSNSLPIGLYLGQTNCITTGPNDNGNQMAIAIQGVTNAFLTFNPAVLGGPSKPVVYISGNGAASGNGGFPTVSGMMAGALIGRADGAKVPSYGVADFTGGIVTWNLGQLHLGRSGAANGTNTTAVGILSFDDGTITVNDIWCGWQQADGLGAQGANPGIGTINIGADATLKVNNTLRLALAANNNAVAGTAGTINVSGGTLSASAITNGAGVGSINMTNATWQVAITPGVTAYGNANVTDFTTGGTTNTISVSFASFPSVYPVTTRLVAYSALGGNGLANVGLVLPSGGGYAGYLTNDTAANAIDLVLTAGASPSNIAWTGSDPSGNWDVATTFNWTNGTGASVQFHQLDAVRFDDTATGTTSVNLVGGTPLTPSGLVVTNNSLTYTFGGSGSLTGAGVTGGAIPGGLVKQGTGTLILANTTPDTYLGGVTISSGVLQVGDGATPGSGGFPASVAVSNNGGLVVNRPPGDTFTLNDSVSGTGGVTNAGAGTLLITSANTFSGPVGVAAGATLQLGNSAALGTTAGSTYVASGGTLDLNGITPGTEPLIVQGTGVSGIGAVVNNSNSGNPHVGTLTLAGDTLLGGSSRWDLTNTLSASTPYNVTLAYPGYCEWRDLNASTAVNNLTVSSGTLGWVGVTAAGSGGTLEITGGAAIKFYNDGALIANVTKPVMLDANSTVINASGANVISAPISLDGYDTFDIAGTSLTLSGALSGSGTVYKTTDASPLIITGSSPAFAGNVLLYLGKVRLDGTLGTGTSSSINTQPNTLLAGLGVNNGPVDIQGGLTPGDAGVVGTNVFGSLTLEYSALLTNNLSSSASGASSRIVVNGDLTMNNPTVYLNPINGTLEANRPYTLITYSGSFNGSLPAVQTASTSIYGITLSNATTLNPKQIQAVVTNGQPDVLVWDNASGNAEWDIQLSQNWSNTTTHVPNDVFYSADVAVLNDTITNSAFSATTIDIGGGAAVAPSVLTNNSSVNYTLTGAGKITSGSSIVKLGSGTLTISNANDFSGPVSVYGGTLLAASATALGGTSGTITVTNGGTLDIGFHLGAKPLVVSGAGVGGLGAIVNNNGAPVYDDSSGGLANVVTLTGDATFGGSNRWDIGSPTGAILSTGSKSNNITYVGTGVVPGSYFEWNSVTVDPGLANISIIGTELGVKGMTNLGNPTNTVTINGGAQLTFWGGSDYSKNYYVKSNGTMLVRRDGPVFNLTTTLEGGATFHSIDNAKVMTAPVTLLGVAQFLSDSATCTFSNVLSGAGGVAWTGNGSQFAFAAANTYTGPTYIGSGLTLALLGNGSILDSSTIQFGGSDTNGFRVDATGRGDQTLTVANGQTLTGSGRVNGALTVSGGATVAPGTNSASPTFGAIGAAGAIALNGTTTVKVYNPGQNDVVQSGTSISYGGTLNVLFLPGTLAAGNSWKLFNAPVGTYSGSFTVSPSSPGSGLAWDTSHLTTDGTLHVVALSSPGFTSIMVGAGQVTINGTNGPANGYYTVLTTTNLVPPITWQPLATGQQFNGSGNFTWTTNYNAGEPSRYYRLQLQ